MFRPLRRKTRAISDEKAKALLSNERRGVLAVNGDDGYPLAVPVNFLYDEEAGKIYIHGAKAGHKVDALKCCDKVCFTVYDNEHTMSGEEWAPYVQSTVVFGRCALIDDYEQAAAKIGRMAAKYYPESEDIDGELKKSGHGMLLYEIDIEHLTGKQVQER